MGRIKDVSEIMEITRLNRACPEKMALKIITKKIDRAIRFQAENRHTFTVIQIPSILVSIPDFNRKNVTLKIYNHYQDLGFDCLKDVDGDRYKIKISWDQQESSDSDDSDSSPESEDSIDFGEPVAKKEKEVPAETKTIVLTKESLASRVKNLG